MSRIVRGIALVGALSALATACSGGSTDPATPPPAPTVTSLTISPPSASFVSLGQAANLSSEVRLSNGSVGNQTVTWTSDNASVATVSNGLVTATGNGQTTIKASVGTVSATAAVTVNQTVVSVSLVPGDTVIKSAAKLRGTALDARGNPVAGASVQWEALTPAITTVDASGNLTPKSTGVARIRITSGTFTSTAIVRTVSNVTKLADLLPLFEYSGTSGLRKAVSDISQSHADARLATIAKVWSYLETIFPSSGSPTTTMYFTKWSAIWTEFSPYCGGVFLANQTAWQQCTTPIQQHFLIPEKEPDDYQLIARFLSRQFLIASNNDARAFPWFTEGLTQWLSGGSFQGNVIVGAPAAVSVQDFKSGDTQNLLSPLDVLMRLSLAEYYENLPQRTPVAVRMAQGVILMAYLAKNYPAVIPAILTRIRATPGAGFTNDQLINEILTGTGKSTAELQAAYIVFGRAL